MLKPISVAFAGAQGSGKTTMAMALASYFSSKGVLTSYTKEYAREFIHAYGIPKTIYDQYLIQVGQIHEESLAAPKASLRVTDSPIFLACVYGLPFWEKDMEQSPALFMQKLLRNSLQHMNYDVIFLTRPHRGPKSSLIDGIRKRPLKQVAVDARRIEAFTELFNTEVIRLSGHITVMTQEAIKIVEKMLQGGEHESQNRESG